MLDMNLIHKALANPLRRDILAWLRAPAATFPDDYVGNGRGVPVHAIQARSGLAQSTVSMHVALLVDAGLLVPRRVGQWVFLSRNEEAIRTFTERIRMHL